MMPKFEIRNSLRQAQGPESSRGTKFEIGIPPWARRCLVLAAVFFLAGWLIAPASAAPIAGGRIVYSNNSTTPQNRAYTAGTPGSFGAETAAVAGAIPSFMVDRAAPTRNEHIAGYVTTGGVLYIIRWNGTSWSAEWNVTVGGDGVNGRRFDIAYENTSGRAMVVYSTNANQGLAYRVWNGTSWTAATNFTAVRLTNIPAWIKLLPRPGSNEIALTVSDTGTTTANTAKLTSLIWDGTSAWGNEPAAAHATVMYNTTGQLIQNDLFDHAYETNTGYLMVVWTQSTPQQYYRRFSGTPTRSWGTSTSFGGTGRAAPLQMFAASDPNSNNIVAGWNRSASATVYATVWTGAAWSTITSVGTNGVNPTAINKKTINGEWLVTGGTSYPVVVWGTSTAATVGYNYATVSGTTVTWQTAATFAFAGTAPGAWAWMDLDRDPYSPDIAMLMFSDANSDLWAKQLTVAAGPTFTWGNADGGTALTAILTNATTQNFGFAYDRYPILTVANGPERPAASTTGPTATDQVVDQFTLTALPGTASVSQVVITLGGAGASHVTNVKLWRDAATYGVLNTPADVQVGTTVTCAPTCTTATFSTLTESVGTTAVRYLVTYSYTGANNGDTLTSQVTGATATGYTTVNNATASNIITVDAVPPALITNFTATSGQNAQVPLAWTNPTDAALAEVVVRRNTGSYPTGHTTGTQVYQSLSPVSGGAVNAADTTGPPVKGTTYYYAVYSRDSYGNWNDTTTPGSNAATAVPGPIAATLSPMDVKPLELAATAPEEFIRLTVTTDILTATLQSLTLAKAAGSTVADANLQVRLIRSTNVTYGDGDDVVIAGPTPFSGGALTFSGLTETIGTGASSYYFVVLEAAAGTVGQTAGVNITGFSISPGTAASTNLPTTYGTVPIGTAPKTTVTATDYPAAASVDQGQTSVPLLKFQLATDKASVTWTAMKLDKIGTNTNLGDVSFKIWKSARNRPTFDPWADTVIGSGTFSAAMGQSVTLSTAQTVTVYSQYYFITYDIAATATLGTTVGARLADATYFTVTGDGVNAFTAVSSGTPTIAAPTVTPTISDNPAPSPLDRGQTNAPMLKFTLQTDNSTATWTAMKLDKIGTNANLGDVSFKIWKDTDNTGIFDPLADAVIGTGTFSTGTGQSVTLTTSQTITTTPQWFYITYDVSGAATTGTTVGAQIQNNTYFTLTGANVAAFTSVASGTPTINAAPAVTVTPSNYPPPASVTQGQSDVPMLKVSLAAASGTAYWTAMKLDKIGTNVNLGDVSFKIWKSANNTSTFNAAADTVIGSGTFSTATGQSLTLSQQQTIGTTAQWFFVTYSIHTAAATATTVGAQLANNTYFTMNGGTVNTFTSTASSAPTIGASGATVSILNPRDGGKIGGTFKVQVLVYVPSGLSNLTALSLSNDGGMSYTFYSFNLTTDKNANYYAGSTTTALYEKAFILTDGSYHFKAQATTTGAVTSVSRGVRVGYTASLLGDGMLLVRDNSSQLCMDCHALNTHSSQSTSTSYGNWANVCLDCHTPHNTKNVRLIRETIVTPNSGTKTKVDFRNTTGDAQYSYADSTNTTYSYNNICQVCHTQTKNPTTSTARWRNSGTTFDAHYTAAAGTQKCTTCHSHKDGFKGGESGGDVPCSGCHSNIWSPMNTTASTYHHYLQNAEATVLAGSGSKYPLVTSLGNTTDTNRRCLVCHVDHDIFRPDLNASGGRGKNLRTDANVLPNTSANFTNTDFDATGGGLCLSCHVTAQTKSYAQPDSTTVTVSVPNDVTAGTATGTQSTTSLQDTNQNWTTNALNGTSVTITGGTGAGQVRTISSNTSNTLTVSTSWTTTPVSGSSTYTVSDTKANQISAFNLSKHQYTTSSTFSGTGTNTFNANCVKCHNDTLAKDKQTSTTKFGLHDSTLRTMSAPLGATPTDPLEQNFCFQCHSARDGTTNALLTTYWATGNKTTDWYGAASMATPAMNLYALYNDAAKLRKHNVGGYAGVHRPSPKDEDRTRLSANRHVECADCHNPHAAKAGLHTQGTAGTNLISGSGPLTGAPGVKLTFTGDSGTATGTQSTTTLQDTSKAWTVNAFAGMSVIITGGTGAGQTRGISSNTANTLTVAPAWGTTPVSGSSTYSLGWGAPSAYPTEVGRAEKEHEICFQCHSSYNTSLASWGLPANGSGTATGTQSTTTLADTSKAWTANAFTGMIVTITGGTGSGQSRAIVSNTATVLTVNPAWTTTPVSGSSTYVIDAGWTDVSREFNPNNRSGHPVMTGLDNYPNSTAVGTPSKKGLQTGALKAPWNTNIGTQMMMCSDCHGNDAVSPAVQGPHGSAAQFMLSGPNGNNWPNVTLGSSAANFATTWCANCHNTNTNVHTEGNHSSQPCYACHIVIPHGGRMSRLIGDRDTMPARYAYGNTLTNMQIQSFTKTAASSYGTGNCQAACAGTHGTAASENW